MAEFRGSSISDILVGTADADHIADWQGGHDRLYGGGGNDRLSIDRMSGPSGSQVWMWGEGGDDRMAAAGPLAGTLIAMLDGGDGNDNIEAFRATKVKISAGLGDDVVSVSTVGVATIATGDGRDVALIAKMQQLATVDLGAGDDMLFIEASEKDDRLALTLGSGRDTVFLAPDASTNQSHTTLLIFRDFETGAFKDRLNATDFLRAAGISTSDPLASGHFRLVQRGDDTLLLLDRDAAGSMHRWETLARFEDCDVGSFTPYNLGAAINFSAPTPGPAYGDAAALLL